MSHIAVVDGSLRRVRQLTGDWERTRSRQGIEVPTQTNKRFGVAGTDLGASFFDGDRLWFLFGDTWPDPGLKDSIAWTRDANPDDGLTLTFLTRPDGIWSAPRLARSRGPFDAGVCAVPTGGFFADGRRYVVYTGDVRMVDPHTPTEHAVMGSSTICTPAAGGDDLTDLYEVRELSWESDGGRFINVGAVVMPGTVLGLPFSGPTLLMWGSGTYRASDAYLAVVPARHDAIASTESWRYFAGLDAARAPIWKPDESASTRLFSRPAGKADDGIGEISAMWIGPLGVWMLAYTTAHTLGVVFRTAPQPWGPWSAPQLLYDPATPGVGFGDLIHQRWKDGGIEGTDLLYDRGRGPEGGAPYGAYLIDRFTRADGPDRARVYFAMSTWNPYQAHLMTATLEHRVGDVRVDMDERPPGWEVLKGDADDRAEAASRWNGALRDAGERRVQVDVGRGLREAVLEAFHQRGQIEPDNPVELPGLISGGLSMVRSRFGPGKNNFEFVAPALTGGGILFNAANNDPWPPQWGPSAHLGNAYSYDAVSLIQSDALDTKVDPGILERRHDRLVMAAQTAGRAVFFTRDREPAPPPSTPWPWSGPFPVIAVEEDDKRHPLVDVRGNPALITSTFGSERTNFELIVPDASRGIRHYWFDNDPMFPMLGDWRLAPTFGQAIGRVDAVALIQSAAPADQNGALEVVARQGGTLWYLWRDAGLVWRGPVRIDIGGAAGIPHLLQTGYGAHARDVCLVTPIDPGGFVTFWRDNRSPDPADGGWASEAAAETGTTFSSVALVAGPFGPAPGNIELVAAAGNGSAQRYFREVGDGRWRPAGAVPL